MIHWLALCRNGVKFDAIWIAVGGERGGKSRLKHIVSPGHERALGFLLRCVLSGSTLPAHCRKDHRRKLHSMLASTRGKTSVLPRFWRLQSQQFGRADR